MDPITTSTVCIGTIGFASAAALAIADKFLTVPEDPRIGKVLECLPGANCGGCGFAGCADYARAIVLKGQADCCFGGP
jgi:Na+-translocating ferredoxin:NAD+ oxidoreductase subunit B